jgi:hypothetical protein
MQHTSGICHQCVALTSTSGATPGILKPIFAAKSEAPVPSAIRVGIAPDPAVYFVAAYWN